MENKILDRFDCACIYIADNTINGTQCQVKYSNIRQTSKIMTSNGLERRGRRAYEPQRFASALTDGEPGGSPARCDPGDCINKCPEKAIVMFTMRCICGILAAR